MATAVATVTVDDGTAALGTPTILTPSQGQTVTVTGINLTWSQVTGASGYDARVLDGSSGAVLFSGSLTGLASTSTLVTLPAGPLVAAVRACSGGFTGRRVARGARRASR